MIQFFTENNLSPTHWVLFAVCGILVGMAKSGISGAGLAVIPLMAQIFGAKHSVAILLPMLIFADIIAVKHYNKHANWKYVFRLMPWALAGIVAGAILGNIINDEQFKKILAVIIIIGVLLIIWQDIRKNKSVPDNWWFTAILGLAGGFTTMIGNAAGPVMSLYLLSMRLPKNSYIGTGAWFYFILNILKMPVHIFYWKTLNSKALGYDLIILPIIALGAVLGVWLVKLLPEKAYRIFIIASTIIAAALLI